MSQIKILFLAANPLDTERLSLDEEARGIDRRLRASKYRDSIVLKTWWAVQPDDLLQSLNEEDPHIVHFSGHGAGSGGLAFQNELGEAHLISGASLKRLFTALKGNIRIVVLNACYSEEQAKAIVHCVDCVIGMNNSIGDKAARKFAASFYRAIAFGQSVQNAFDQGIASLAIENLGQEDFPTLLTRKEVNANNLFLIKDPQIDNKSPQVVLSKEMMSRVVKEVPNKRMQKKQGDHFLRTKLPSLVGKIRYKEDLSIIMLDIDELTVINKQYGKHVGNIVIASIARILFVESGTEYSGRCGDDTYYVMVSGSDIDKAEAVAMHLSSCVRINPWKSVAAGLRVSCTFGVSQLQKDEPVKDWVIRAAIAMKDAKEKNIDQIKLFESIKKSGYSYSADVRTASLYLAKDQSREFEHYYS